MFWFILSGYHVFSTVSRASMNIVNFFLGTSVCIYFKVIYPGMDRHLTYRGNGKLPDGIHVVHFIYRYFNLFRCVNSQLFIKKKTIVGCFDSYFLCWRFTRAYNILDQYFSIDSHRVCNLCIHEQRAKVLHCTDVLRHVDILYYIQVRFHLACSSLSTYYSIKHHTFYF